MALSCTVFAMFDLIEYCANEIRVMDHSRSLEVVPFHSVPMISYLLEVLGVVESQLSVACWVSFTAC